MSALRTCIECGLAAFDVDDLEMFIKKSNGKYRRANLCKECYNKRQKSYKNEHKEQIKQYKRRHYLKHREEIQKRASERYRFWRLEHREELLVKEQRDRDEKRTWFWLKQLELVAAKGGMPLTCWHCGKLITKMEGIVPEALVFHSVDGNHENWDLENKVPVHRGCHSTLHTKDRKGVTAEERRVMINEEAEALFRRQHKSS